MSSESSHYTSGRLLSNTTCMHIHDSKSFLLLFQKCFTEKDTTAHCFEFLSSLVFHCCVYTKKYVNTRGISLGRERGKKVGWKRKNNNFCLLVDKNWDFDGFIVEHTHRIHTLTKLALDHVFYIKKKKYFLCLFVLSTNNSA